MHFSWSNAFCCEFVILSIILFSSSCWLYLYFDQDFSNNVLLSCSSADSFSLRIRMLENKINWSVEVLCNMIRVSYFCPLARDSGIPSSSRGFSSLAFFSSLRMDFSILLFFFSSRAFTIAGSIFFFFFSGSALGETWICWLFWTR